MASDKLTEKQKRFADEYMIDLNGTQAAIRAGYSAKTAMEQGSRLLSNVKVQEYLSESRQKVSEKLELSHEWVLTRLKEISDRCMVAEPVMVKGEDGQMVESGEYRFDSSGANKSTELIGKHLGMFVTKMEHTGKDGKDLIPARILTKKEAKELMSSLANEY